MAAAADLRFALEELVAEFQAVHSGIDVTATYGSSGNFFAQLSNRAPYDVYLSADVEYPRRLAEAGLAVERSLREYAVGYIVLWAPADSALNFAGQGIESLLAPQVRKIAVANPQHAPYGRAAVAALQSRGIYEQVQDRLVFGENVAQALQFVESGAADVGVIARARAESPPMPGRGKHWRGPAESYPPLRQGGVIMAGAQDRDAAERFLDFVAGADGAAILKRYGFGPPGE
ncbi:MAG TPA: molybdate ABC transporter substrate-binding protein [Lacipirellulaceae bacterium]|nr:molybdate ABC transporter substrate-binding protein [Lacipirellulaceae bacterium]